MIVKRIPRRAGHGRGKAEMVGSLCSYILAGDLADPADKLICGGALNAMSATQAGWIAEMQALSTECKRSPMPVVHYVLSWRHGETPSHVQIEDAVKTFAQEMGYGDNALVWGAHGNTSNVHVHLAVCRYNDALGRAIRPYRGLDHDLALRTVARIEAAQGWTPEGRARYHGHDDMVVRTDAPGTPLGLGYRARGAEIRSGKKSAMRMAQERLTAALTQARNWDELHAMLAYVGDARYEPRGGGAVIVVDGVAMKASSIAKDASLRRLEARLGPYRSPDAIISKSVEAASPRPPEPIDADAGKYLEAREAARKARQKARAALDVSIEERRAALKATQEAERGEINTRSWKGKGEAKNALVAALAERHKRQRDELQSTIDAERKALRSAYPDWPDYATWKARRAASREAAPLAANDAPSATNRANNRETAQLVANCATERKTAHAPTNGAKVRETAQFATNRAIKHEIAQFATKDPIQLRIDAALAAAGEAPQRRGWTADEIRARIVLIVDRMNEDSRRRLIDDGWRPALTLATAPGRYRALILADMTGVAGEREAARELSRRLTQRYADLPSAPAGEAFPVARVIEAVRQICLKAMSEIATIAAALIGPPAKDAAESDGVCWSEGEAAEEKSADTLDDESRRPDGPSM